MKHPGRKTRRRTATATGVVEPNRRDADSEPPDWPGLQDNSKGPAPLPHGSRRAAASCEWDDWTWQLRKRIRSLAGLRRRFPSLRPTAGMEEAVRQFPMAITPYYAALIRDLDFSDPIFRMCVPSELETCDPFFLNADPLEEDKHMPVPGLVHRYRDRALLMATTACSVYCRHCTRKRVAGQTECNINSIRLTQATEYLSVHPEIRDVVISGGDPFTLKTSVLERVIKALRGVPSIEVIRIGTRTPVVLPMRITDELTEMLRRYHPIYVNVHFNHPAELTAAAVAACERLADAGIPVGNQTVLLKGVNDDAVLLGDLFRKLVKARVRPYYLFQCDLVSGAEHFRTPISKGIEIMEYLRGRVSGLAIPTFVVDAPHGGGKIPLLPNYVISTSPTHTALRNYDGHIVSYPEPRGESTEIRMYSEERENGGVWGITSGAAPCIGGRERPHVGML